jgi:hypothetical protein
MLPAVPPIRYYGQPEFGLPLVTPAEPDFAALVRQIRSLPDHPMARRGPGAEASRGPGRAHTVILRMFANSAIHRLVNAPAAELAPWFERIARATPLRLRRP